MNKDLLHLKVIREILSQISLGVYRHGQRLPAERQLCRTFGVSRGTLRRALDDLETMGAIQIRPQSGAYVQKIAKNRVSNNVLPRNVSAITLEEVIVARKAIELAAIELAAERATKTDIKKLEKCVAQMHTHIEHLPEYLKFDIQFHEQLVKAGKNAALIAAFDAIGDYHKYSQVFSSSSQTCETDALKHHRRIVDALAEGNARKCVMALRRHLESMLTKSE